LSTNVESVAVFHIVEIEKEVLLLKRALEFSHSLGQFLPPTFATAMEELARRPDANAPNRRAAL
jgi:hypothetical protein